MKTRKKAIKKAGRKDTNRNDEVRIKKAGTKNKMKKKAVKKTSRKDKPGIKKKRTRKNDETVKMERPVQEERKGRLLVNIGKALFLVAVLAGFWYLFDWWLGRK